MFSRNCLVITLCSLILFIAVSVQAQDEPEKAPSLNDAKTLADIFACVRYEAGKIDTPDPKEGAAAIAGILTPAGNKLLEIAQNSTEKMQGYGMKFSAIAYLDQAGIEGTEEKLETFLKELAAQEDIKDLAEPLQFRSLLMFARMKGVETAEPRVEAFLKELDAKTKTEQRTAMLHNGRFFLFSEKVKKAEASPANFDKFKSEVKEWITGQNVPFSEVLSLGFEVARRNKVSAEQIAKELTGYIQSPQCALPPGAKEELVKETETALRLAVGVDPKLYGKTLDDKDFDWKSLRDKYVLIKFTATWCGPCKMEIPGMLEAYKKYKDKGLEIVSVYMWERGDDPIAGIKEFVAEEKLPWIILAEDLSGKAGKPEYGEFYGIRYVPTMVLADKEGKIILQEARGAALKKKLAEIFE